MRVELIDSTLYPIRKIATCAREAYQSVGNEKNTDEELVALLIRENELSPLEHAFITFRVIGASRVVTHQIVRHRMASYTQESQKFADQSEAGFVIPEGLDEIPAFLLKKHIEDSIRVYNNLLAFGVSKDAARYVLPNAKKSNIVVTMNFRSLINFLSQRMCGKASKEMISVATEIRNVAAKICPEIFNKDFARCRIEHGFKCKRAGKCNRK